MTGGWSVRPRDVNIMHGPQVFEVVFDRGGGFREVFDTFADRDLAEALAKRRNDRGVVPPKGGGA